MKIKDQIRSRREALGLSMRDLAKRVGVSETAVRHWEGGRSYPGKSKARLVEEALTMTIDWHEGEKSGSGELVNTATAMLDPRDVQFLLTYCRLPLAVKNAINTLAEAHLKALDEARGMSVHRDDQVPPNSFEGTQTQ